MTDDMPEWLARVAERHGVRFPQDDRDPFTDGWPSHDDIIRKYPPDDQNSPRAVHGPRTSHPDIKASTDQLASAFQKENPS